MTLDDAEKEFAEFARIGFGLGFDDKEQQLDFAAVRGSADSNAVVKRLRNEKTAIQQRAQKMRQLLEKF